jgi:hypothetical protein
MERRIPDNIHMVNRRARRAVSVRVAHPGGARSLDRVNQLATTAKKTGATLENPEITFAEWLKSQTNAQDKRRRLYSIHEKLLDSLKKAGMHHEWLSQNAFIEGATRSTSAWQAALAQVESAKWKPWKDYKRVQECQTSWMGFKPVCCDSKAVAVPVGCNHRMCPLCNAHRAEHYRSRIRSLFEVVGNPQLLTLTVPSVRKLTSETIRVLRARLKAFLRENSPLLMGGVYSIEITYNKVEKTWHPHIHALVDVSDYRKKLPYWEFCERKWRLEFSWLVLTQGRAVAGKRRWRRGDYAEWVAGIDPRSRVSPFGRIGHRRTIDLRPVSSDKKAAYEVLKYITKAAAFVDDYKAVAEFLTAVKGVRAIQTFGNCYGFKLDDPPIEAHLACECGANKFEPIGMLGLGMCKMSPEGKWYVRDDAPVHGRQRCRGQTTKGAHQC